MIVKDLNSMLLVANSRLERQTQQDRDYTVPIMTVERAVFSVYK